VLFSQGIYLYELKVTDEAGQSSTSNVHVFVKKPSGNPPKGKLFEASKPVRLYTIFLRH
jgi:hypothetical protein